MPALPENVMPANENDRSFDFVPTVAAEAMASSVLPGPSAFFSLSLVCRRSVQLMKKFLGRINEYISKSWPFVAAGPRLLFPLFENRRTGAGVKFAELGSKQAKKEMPYSKFSVRM
ncbi:MAG: hypothetical protein C6W56_12875 [Caldibacillus debilis]|nr:MAG: hypothetical protein BAA03_00120 [Caldibacillus debilis]REJ26177.1 MAG: hypothetical protein C6W56_12875 [Caldibacillus debilis]